MGVLEFQKLPVNTLVGADWKTFKGITQGQTIGKGYKTKYQLTKAICRLLSCLKPIQDRIRQTPEKSGDQDGAGFYFRALA